MLSTMFCRALHLLLLATAVLAAQDFYKELGGQSPAPLSPSSLLRARSSLARRRPSPPPVDRQANEATIKKAYRKIAKANHPDKNKDPLAQQKFADAANGACARALARSPRPRRYACASSADPRAPGSCSVRGSDGLGGACFVRPLVAPGPSPY